MKLGNTRVLIWLLSALLFAGCGASKKSSGNNQSSDLTSRGTPDSDGKDPDSNSKVEYYALCNGFSGPNLNGVVTTYLNPVTNQYEWDFIRMEIKEIPVQIEDKDSFYIQFYRWQEDVPGQPYTNPAAVGIYFQYEDGTWLNNELVNNVSKNSIEKLIADNNLAGVTVKNFFDKTILVLAGMDLEYDAIMINTYGADTGTAALTRTDVLLPAFAADPNIYAETHPAQSLQGLHPNYERKDSGLTQWQFFQETQALCGF